MDDLEEVARHLAAELQVAPRRAGKMHDLVLGIDDQHRRTCLCQDPQM